MFAEKIEHLLASLNEAQRAAVVCGPGPVLVLAGAGSGKTRVLINRLAYLIGNGLATPDSIMAVTFTNKAAGEMRERLERIGGFNLSSYWIGTFHSLGARILRNEAHLIGYDRNFSIYDSDDQLSCLKLILGEKQLPADRFHPKAVGYQISNAKNAFIRPDEFARAANSPFDEQIAVIYKRYIAMLRENNAVDFDDLLMLPVILLHEQPNILEYYQNRFSNILVDEYQDTNRAQYHLVKLLAAKHRNVFVVGDDDQSIYRWRGADLRNILEFGKEYPDCKIFRLEQNYRSTKNILAAAHSVVVNNHGRHEKELWTEKDIGAKIQLLDTGTENDEAEFVVEKIQEEFIGGKRNFRDFAILYRTNAQSRSLEDALRRHSIPYIIVGGLRFYERKEVKDVLGYLYVVANPQDTINLRRIINYPLRGIGDATLQKVQQLAIENNLTFFEALGKVDLVPGFSDRIKNTVKTFYEFIYKYISLKNVISVTELVNSLVEETGILQNYKAEGTPDAMARIENIRELLNAIHEYALMKPQATLDGFLEQVSLIADIDTWDDRSNAATLMTLHSAKGLEFPVVFICGLEDGLFPLSRSLQTLDDLEEERRLFYVGATRAKEKLYLAWASNRRRFGESQSGIPSRFLKEVDSNLIEHHSLRRVYYEPRRRTAMRRKGDDDFAQVMPDYEELSQETKKLRPGVTVRHSHFGLGEVMKVDGKGANMKAVVRFSEVGEKTLMVQYANLQIL